MSSLDIWVNAKKTPEEIEEAKIQAKEMQRKKKNMNRKPPSKKSFRGESIRSRKTASYKDDSDYSGEDDKFIVDDDDDEVEEILESEDDDFDENLEDEEEDDDEISLHDDEESDDGIEHDIKESKPVASSRSSRAAARKIHGGTKTDALSVDSDSDDDDDDDDDEGESFLPSRDHRPSMPSRLLQQKTETAKKRHNPSLKASLANAEKKKRKTSGGSSLMLLNAPALKKGKPNSSIGAKRENPNDDDEEVTSPCYTPKKPKNLGKSINPEEEYENILSSDEENTINHSISNAKKSRVASVGETSRFFGATKESKSKSKMILLDDSDSDSSDFDEPKKSRFNIKKSHALEDTPEPKDVDRKRRLKKFTKTNKNGVSNQKTSRIFSIDDSSDEDNMVNVDNANVDDAGFDEDLKVAMKLSLEAKRKTDEKKKKKGNEGENEIEMILDDSSDDEDADQGDEYYDQEKETASNVLKSAEKLSGHVIRAMSGWFGNKEGGGSIQGIIVDGALSFGNIDESKSGNDKESPSNGKGDNDTHTWISQAIMAKAIPNVKLSQYQLVGVNWMALLNGMTCEVGTKGTKNVNGVLADEMGLVCIIPTFLRKIE